MSKTPMCPFYVRPHAEKPNIISCEAGKLNLCDKQSKDLYTLRYCNSERWRLCTIAAALNLYYERNN